MMQILTDPAQLAEFLATSLRLSVPIVFAALGGVLSERSGVFNIGLEGMMLAGAFGAAVGAFFEARPMPASRSACSAARRARSSSPISRSRSG